jgi:sodium/hydrogen antiporter
VALALAGARLGGGAITFVSWFGPRGLASVVFALLALEEIGEPLAGQAVTIISLTVLLSVIVHGATADPLARRFGPRLTPAARGPGHAAMPEIRERRLIRRAAASAPPPGSPPGSLPT